MHLRASVRDRGHALRVYDGVGDRAIAHDTPVDEHVLRATRRSLLGKCCDVTDEGDVPTLATDLDQVASIAIKLIQPITERCDRGNLQDLPARARERNPDL